MARGPRAGTLICTGHRVSGIPSPRIGTARSFVALSDKLNAASDEYAAVREAVEGLTAILDAHAGLVFFPQPVDLLYSLYRHQSESFVRFERMVRERGERMLELFAFEPHKRTHEADELLLVPLTWRQKIIGLAAFDRDGRKLPMNAEANLIGLCNHVAAIVGLKAQQARMSANAYSPMPLEDLEDAVAVQKSLLPDIPPSSVCGLSIAAHTQAAEHVGGDYFDLILLDHKRIGIAIADVEGKGVSAALFGNMLRSTVHFLARETPSTASVVGKINAILHKEAVASQKLFSLFYAVYDPSVKILSYAGSGHVHPMVLRSREGTVERLHSDGMLIGIEPAQRLRERAALLREGDLLLFFTDGVSDRMNESGEVFGDLRLAELLQRSNGKTVEEILQHILDELGTFTALPCTDDMTLILAKVL